MPFVDSFKDLGILVDTEIKCHGHFRSIVETSSGMSVNLLNSTLRFFIEFMLTLYIIHVRLIRVSFMCLEHGIYIEHEIPGKYAETMDKNN